jgi:hypothetical protein
MQYLYTEFFLTGQTKNRLNSPFVIKDTDLNHHLAQENSTGNKYWSPPVRKTWFLKPQTQNEP